MPFARAMPAFRANGAAAAASIAQRHRAAHTARAAPAFATLQGRGATPVTRASMR